MLLVTGELLWTGADVAVTLVLTLGVVVTWRTETSVHRTTVNARPTCIQHHARSTVSHHSGMIQYRDDFRS